VIRTPDKILLALMLCTAFSVIPFLAVGARPPSRRRPTSVSAACYLEQGFGVFLFFRCMALAWDGMGETRLAAYAGVGGMCLAMYWLTAASTLREGENWAWKSIVVLSAGRVFALFPYGAILSALSLSLLMPLKSRGFFMAEDGATECPPRSQNDHGAGGPGSSQDD